MVSTRRQQSGNVREATRAINKGGEAALRKMLGIRPAKKPVRSRPRSRDTCEREVKRLRRIIDQLKAGRSVAVQRARPAPDFRTANLFEKTPFMIGGEPYQRPEILWAQSQRTNAQNRNRRPPPKRF